MKTPSMHGLIEVAALLPGGIGHAFRGRYSNPGAKGYAVPNLGLKSELKDRLNDRVRLLDVFDTLRRDIDVNGSMQSVDEFNQKVIGMLTSNKAREAFDLPLESDATALWPAGIDTQRIHSNWDIHVINGDLYYDLSVRLPPFDRAVSALVEDIYERGLDKKVMLVISDEFGRTPRITVKPRTKSEVMQPGRDH